MVLLELKVELPGIAEYRDEPVLVGDADADLDDLRRLHVASNLLILQFL
jgi:hypothetical protein